MTVDELKVVAATNRIHELQDQIWEELHTLVEALKGEHSTSTYTKQELLLMYSQSISSNLVDRVAQEVMAVRMQEAFLRDLQEQAMGGGGGGKKKNDTTANSGAHSKSGEVEE